MGGVGQTGCQPSHQIGRETSGYSLGVQHAESVAPATSFRLLGGFEVIVDGVAVRCGGIKQRAVLALLLLEPNRLVPSSRLIEGLWGDAPREGATATLQVYVSNLRKHLPAVDGQSPIVTKSNGYSLNVAPDTIDVQRFTKAAVAASEAMRWQDDALTLRHLETALSLWLGDPLAEFVDQPFAAGAALILQQLHDSLVEQRCEALLNLGQHAVVLPLLHDALARTPLRESLWRLMIVALYRAGRQADALAAFQRCRDLLLDQLGVDPSPEPVALEIAVLRTTRRLQWPTHPGVRRRDRSLWSPPRRRSSCCVWTTASAGMSATGCSSAVATVATS